MASGRRSLPTGFEMVEDGMEREAIYLLFRKMEKDQQYYQKAFEVTGQNGFEEILAGKLRKLIRQMMKIIRSHFRNWKV